MTDETTDQTLTIEEVDARNKRRREFIQRLKKYTRAIKNWESKLSDFHRNVNLQLSAILVMSPTHLQWSISSPWNNKHTNVNIDYHLDNFKTRTAITSPIEPSAYREHSAFYHWDWTDAEHDEIQTWDEQYRPQTLEEQYTDPADY